LRSTILLCVGDSGRRGRRRMTRLNARCQGKRAVRSSTYTPRAVAPLHVCNPRAYGPAFFAFAHAFEVPRIVPRPLCSASAQARRLAAPDIFGTNVCGAARHRARVLARRPLTPSCGSQRAATHRPATATKTGDRAAIRCNHTRHRRRARLRTNRHQRRRSYGPRGACRAPRRWRRSFGGRARVSDPAVMEWCPRSWDHLIGSARAAMMTPSGLLQRLRIDHSTNAARVHTRIHRRWFPFALPRIWRGIILALPDASRDPPSVSTAGTRAGPELPHDEKRGH